MNLLAGWAQGLRLLQESDEVAAGVASGCFSMHAARLVVQRSMQGLRAMPIVLEAVTLGLSCRVGQDRVEPIQRLK